MALLSSKFYENYNLNPESRFALPQGIGELYVLLEMDQLNEILISIQNAFAEEAGPARCSDPNHCEECVEADNMLLNLDPSDLVLDDLIDEKCNWIFSFITVQGLRWLFPGFIRVALEQNPPQPSAVFSLLSQRTSDTFTDEQWISILDLNKFCYKKGWICDQELIHV